MNYRPQKAFGGWVGLLGILVIFGFTLWGINYALGPSDRTLKIMLNIPTYLFLLMYLYSVFGAFNLRYKIEDDGLEIRWALMKKKIGWNEFNEIIAVKGRANLFPLLAVSWPGYMAGMYSAKGLGSVRMFATQTQDGFIYLKTQKGFYGITPADPGLLQVLLDRTGLIVKHVDMELMSSDEKGEGIHEDRTFKLYQHLNWIFLFIFAVYLGIFFPASGAPKFIILLLVLALALYFFNISTAKRMYQFSPLGSYITLLIGLLVTGVFIILSVYGVIVR